MPSGLTPVTAKAVRLKFAKMPLLSVKFTNGSESLLASSELTELNAMSEQIKSMTLYAPSEILKEVNFIDTPGAKLAKEMLTRKRPKTRLKKVCGSDMAKPRNNAAKASELESVEEILKNKRPKGALLHQPKG